MILPFSTRYALSVVFIFILTCAEAYTYLPNLTSYDKEAYKAGRQNWDIGIDDDAIVYFANSDGLLRYIHGEWVLNKTKSEEALHAIFIEGDTIWCGGRDYGYFTKNTTGELDYHHLGTLKGIHVWDIVSFNNTIYFQSENRLLAYNKSTQKLGNSLFNPGLWGLVEWRDELWVIRNGHLGVINDLSFEQRIFFPESKNTEVRKMLVHDDFLHLILFDGRIFKFDGQSYIQVQLSDDVLNTALFTAISYKDKFCLGSISDGLIMLDENNDISQRITSNEGLIENSILSLKSDDNSCIWIGLDYGIARLDLQSPIHDIFDKGASYNILDHKDITYLSTNKGVYYSQGKAPFTQLENTDGQVWKTKKIDGVVYICHTTGLFYIKNGEVVQIYDRSGVMDITKVPETNSYIISTYSGLFLAELSDSKIHYSYSIDLWGYQFLTSDEENKCVWGYTNDLGLINIFLDDQGKVHSKSYKDMTLFDTNFGHVFYNGSQFLDYVNGEFVTTKLLNGIPQDAINISALDISLDGNTVAYIQDHKVKLSVILPDGSIHSFHKSLSNVNSKLIDGYEYLSLYNNELRIATERGVMVYDLSHRAAFTSKLSPIISAVEVDDNKGNVSHYYYPFTSGILKFSDGHKNIKFSFGCDKSYYDVLEFRYKLSPYEDVWSEWTTQKNYKSYTQIKGGDYTFCLQSRINGGSVHLVTQDLSIKKLWYQNTLFLVFSISILVLFSIGFTIYIMNIRHLKKIRSEKKNARKKVAQKSIDMKNEQLLQYVEIISHKNEFLLQVKNALSAMRNNDAITWANKITNEVNNEKKEFLFHKLFSEVQQDFIQKLREQYPTLSNNDIRLISFIRINLGSREIASLMNITPRSMDTNRYRLKKKLGLEKENDLDKFIKTF